jgi:twinkle protein
MSKTFIDKNGTVWTPISSWADMGLPSGAGKKTFLCPSCSETRQPHNRKAQCLSVNYDRGTAYCNNCFKRHMIMEDLKEEIPVYVKPSRPIMHDFPVDLIKFLYGRGLTDKVIKRNKLGHDIKWFAKSKANLPCISLPYYKNNELTGIKYRAITKEFTADAGAEPVVYGYDDIKGDVLIWVEGEFDKLAVEEAGYQNCVSVPNGSQSAACLDKIVDIIRHIKTHIIAVDNDNAGLALKNELIRRLNPAKCRTVTMPNGSKDANDVLLNHGPDELKKCIDGSARVPIKGLVKPSELLSKLSENYYKKGDVGLSTGWHNLDQLYRVKTGQWTVLTGIPNHGKSELLDAIMVNMIVRHNWKFGIFSPENYPIETHMQKIVKKIVGKPFGVDYQGAMSHEDMIGCANALNSNITFIAADEDTHSMESLLELTESMILSEGINGMIIDPWNMIEHNKPNNVSETEYVSSALSKVTFLVRKYNIHLWIVAHPTKMAKIGDKYTIPMPYDISGSAHWNNKADNAVTVYIDSGADVPNNQVQIHVTKVRFRDNGQPGQTELYYDIASGRYTS